MWQRVSFMFVRNVKMWAKPETISAFFCKINSKGHKGRSGGLILTWVFWILTSTEALLTASSLGILCSMAAGTLLCYIARIYRMNVSHQGGLTHISVWSEPRWHSLWYRWSGCPAAPLCLRKNTWINLQSDTKHFKWGKGRKRLKKVFQRIVGIYEWDTKSVKSVPTEAKWSR